MCPCAGLPFGVQGLAGAAPGLPPLPPIVTLPGPEGASAMGPEVSAAITKPATPPLHPQGKVAYLNVTTRALLSVEDGPPGTVPEATQPFAAEAPLTAPGAHCPPTMIYSSLCGSLRARVDQQR